MTAKLHWKLHFLPLQWLSFLPWNVHDLNQNQRNYCILAIWHLWKKKKGLRSTASTIAWNPKNYEVTRGKKTTLIIFSRNFAKQKTNYRPSSNVSPKNICVIWHQLRVSTESRNMAMHLMKKFSIFFFLRIQVNFQHSSMKSAVYNNYCLWP